MKRSRGFVLLTAVFLIGIAAVAMVVITALLRYDLKRTADARADAQVRQLLFAGAADGPAHLEHGETQWTTATPVGEVKTGVQGGECRVTATVDGRSGDQNVRWVRDGTGWRMVGAELR